MENVGVQGETQLVEWTIAVLKGGHVVQATLFKWTKHVFHVRNRLLKENHGLLSWESIVPLKDKCVCVNEQTTVHN